MTFKNLIFNKTYWTVAFILSAGLSLQACQKKSETAPIEAQEESQQTGSQQVAPELKEPITIKHQLGQTTISKRPKKVAALSMNEVDFLDQLNVPIAGMVKDFVPHFLSKYKDDDSVKDLGSIVQPNMEQVYALHTDLILITPLQAQNYNELSQIAPTLHFDINYNNSYDGHISKIEDHLLALGKIFDKEELAQKKVDELNTKLAEVKKITESRPEKALVVLHNNGAFSNFGIKSRYGFVFSDLGVKPANTIIETSLHGEPISSEFIQQSDPDIIYIIDRTAVMEHRDVINSDEVSNPLLRNTKAWKNNHVVFVDADAWYTTSASPTSISIIIDDVIKGYQD